MKKQDKIKKIEVKISLLKKELQKIKDLCDVCEKVEATRVIYKENRMWDVCVRCGFEHNTKDFAEQKENVEVKE